jgi:hypothetical protein
MTLISEVAAVLTNNGYGTFGIDIFAWEYKPDPRNQLAIRPLPGQLPLIASGGSVTDRPGLQIYILNDDLGLAETKAEAIRLLFANSIGTIKQGIFTKNSGIIPLGQQEDGRYMFIVEFEIFGDQN